MCSDGGNGSVSVDTTLDDRSRITEAILSQHDGFAGE